MTIEDFGAMGDLVGGVAVLVTLIYLARQIKQNTNIHASLIRQNFLRRHTAANIAWGRVDTV